MPLSNGLAYAQYTHWHDEYGYLMRVLSGVYRSRLDISSLAAKKQQYFTFVAAQYGVNKGILRLAGHEEVPYAARKFPVLRATGPIGNDGRISRWSLWNGRDYQPIEGPLSVSQRRLPILEAADPIALIRDLERHWSPEKEVERLV